MRLRCRRDTSRPGRTGINLSPIITGAHEAIDLATELIKTGETGAVTDKTDRDPVTELDLTVERTIREFLRHKAPHVGFLGEEGGRSGDQHAELIWAFDPVDGTVNLTHDLPLSAVSLGLVRGDQPVLGVIDLPFLGHRYSALLGHGAYRGNTRIQTSRTTRLDRALVALGDYATGADAEAKNRDELAITRGLTGKVQRVRMLGSAAIDLAWVAEGRLDASITMSNQPWDITAGALIAREAGAAVLDRHGQPHTLSSTSTIATTQQLAHDVLKVLDDLH